MCQVLVRTAPAMATPVCSTRPLGSLLFNMEEMNSEPDWKSPASKRVERNSNSQACEKLLGLIPNAQPTSFADKLLRDVRRLKTSILEEAGQADAVLLAAMLSERGYSVLVRCALGGTETGAPGSCFRNLRHEFVFVRCDCGEFEGMELLVDPHFREQFAIPQPTMAFSALLQLVPEEYVGTSARLLPLVELICGEMAASFEARGLTIPPWRRASAMMSKWLPTKSRDLPVDSAGNSPRSPSPAGMYGKLERMPVLGVVADRLSQQQPRLVTTASKPYQEAEQQLETLALHNQLQASPAHAFATTQQPSLVTPPTALADMLALPAHWGNTSPFEGQSMIDELMRSERVDAPKLAEGLFEAELSHRHTEGSSPPIASFARYSEPLLGRRSVSLLSVQLGTAKQELAKALSTCAVRSQSAATLPQGSSKSGHGQGCPGALAAPPVLSVIDERSGKAQPAMGVQLSRPTATVTHVPPPAGWDGPVIHKVKYGN